MPSGPLSPYFTISPTPYGGRGASATQNIPKDTLVLSCGAPYASVVSREFRKEVCAWCFAWSWEVARKSGWKINAQLYPADAKSVGKAGQGRAHNSNRNGTGAGVWFCGSECRNAWLDDTGDSGSAGVRFIVYSALERCLARMKKGQLKDRGVVDVVTGWETFLQSLEDLDSEGVSLAVLEDAWERAGQLSPIMSDSKHGEATKAPYTAREGKSKAHRSPPIELSEIEVETTRFVLSGLLKKCINETPNNHSSSSLLHISQMALDTSPSIPTVSTSNTAPHPAGTWSDLIDLQDNTTAHFRSKSHTLASNIRVWAFAKYVVYSTLRDTKNLPDRTRALLEMLWVSINTPHHTRIILGREHGNVFGIWDMAPEGVDSEMLGWGLYLFGSYFNHDCSPTLYKRRKGRVMEFHTLRDVLKGEELCIEYVDGQEEVTKRRELLRKGWFFECGCAKCRRDLRESESLPGEAR